ncbi:uncharacterized protein PHACADRAFT_177357 [Phanerochaete carnosa HHB-10118-sp]|uniref:NAD(P)-binding domain-containing protein n=1 Tax=Phanerochaete carnosa (strain HHB-10118-sp) TaxID=650164 RepID=K5UQ53_PHACS|nr:uncharacterized protein PHACADRAFT_177357 [Phanerochaete carnosa HHB-10118-sp]EKM51951.1 hypothetical protein PHACADRAFT_177357 [Phanerochaete carnosa HHB-10118-sp]
MDCADGNLHWVFTGSSTGISRAVTELALFKGDKVVTTLRTPSDVDVLKTKYPATQLLVTRLDVTQPDEILSAFKEAKGIFGRVEGTPETAARDVFETNFWGAANVSREAAMTMSAYAGTAPAAGVGYHSASKASENTLWKPLDGEIDPKWNIKTSLIVLGAVRTPIFYKAEVLSFARGYEGQTASRSIIRSVRDSRLQIGDRPPLRLVIGLDCIGMVEAHLGRLQRELAAYKPWLRDLKEERAGPGPKL